MGFITRRQAGSSSRCCSLEGVNLHMKSVQALLARGPVRAVAWELTLLGLRFGVYAGLLFWIFPLGMAAAFLGVLLAVFGFYMGFSFGPQPHGHADRSGGRQLDFLAKQRPHVAQHPRRVLHGASCMGGLKLPGGAPLFPSMPRPQPAQGAHDGARALPRPWTSRTR